MLGPRRRRRERAGDVANPICCAPGSRRRGAAAPVAPAAEGARRAPAAVPVGARRRPGADGDPRRRVGTGERRPAAGGHGVLVTRPSRRAADARGVTRTRARPRGARDGAAIARRLASGPGPRAADRRGVGPAGQRAVPVRLRRHRPRPHARGAHRAARAGGHRHRRARADARRAGGRPHRRRVRLDARREGPRRGRDRRLRCRRELVDDELARGGILEGRAVVKPLERACPPRGSSSGCCASPPRGSPTSLRARRALRELGRSAARRRRAILLSDAVHNAGPDPRLRRRSVRAARRAAQTDGEHDAELGAELARIGHGRPGPVRDHRQVAPALNRLLAG